MELLKKRDADDDDHYDHVWISMYNIRTTSISRNTTHDNDMAFFSTAATARKREYCSKVSGGVLEKKVD